MAVASTTERGAGTEAEFEDSWAALALVFSESVPGEKVKGLFRAMVLGERWHPAGLKRAVADCVKTLRYFPKPAELRMAYELWQSGAAFEARAGVSAALPAPRPTPEQRSLHQRRHAVLMQLVREMTARSHSPAELRRYVEERGRKRREAEAAGAEYLTELEERLRDAGLPHKYVPARERTWRCLICRDEGWVRDELAPVGTAERLARCPCKRGS